MQRGSVVQKLNAKKKYLSSVIIEEEIDFDNFDEYLNDLFEAKNQ
jgi:hypothetical protein